MLFKCQTVAISFRSKQFFVPFPFSRLLASRAKTFPIIFLFVLLCPPVVSSEDVIVMPVLIKKKLNTKKDEHTNYIIVIFIFTQFTVYSLGSGVKYCGLQLINISKHIVVFENVFEFYVTQDYNKNCSTDCRIT